MNKKSTNFKFVIAAVYFTILIIFLYLLFSTIDIKDLTNYEYIRSKKDLILKYKNDNFLLLFIIFIIGTVLWNLLLGVGTPIALFSGFIFGKWLGTFIVVFGNTMGAMLIYLLAKAFFSEFIKNNFTNKFSKFIKFFNKNETLYFMFFRLLGGGGAPFPIQNVIPVIFNMSVKNYIIATFIGIIPTTFIAVALGSGIGNVLNQKTELTALSVFSTPEVYLPIAGFFILVLITFLLKKRIFK